MKKLTKDALLTRDDLVEKLKEKIEALNQHETLVNEAIASMNETIDSYNDILREVEQWKDDVVSLMDDYIGERSEKWSETETAQNYEEWKGEFENLDLDPAEALDNIDFTVPSHVEEIEALPEQPGS